jgi:conjugal transfer/entry exclusion protein
MANGTAELAQLIDSKGDCAEALWELAQQQEILIAEQRMSELMPLLAKKQRLLEQLDQLQQQLQPFAEQAAETRDWAHPADRERCRTRQQKTDQLLREIMALDARCEGQLTSSRNALAEQLQQSTGAQQAAKAYRASQATGTSRGGRLDLTAG